MNRVNIIRNLKRAKLKDEEDESQVIPSPHVIQAFPRKKKDEKSGYEDKLNAYNDLIYSSSKKINIQRQRSILRKRLLEVIRWLNSTGLRSCLIVSRLDDLKDCVSLCEATEMILRQKKIVIPKAQHKSTPEKLKNYVEILENELLYVPFVNSSETVKFICEGNEEVIIDYCEFLYNNYLQSINLEGLVIDENPQLDCIHDKILKMYSPNKNTESKEGLKKAREGTPAKRNLDAKFERHSEVKQITVEDSQNGTKEKEKEIMATPALKVKRIRIRPTKENGSRTGSLSDRNVTQSLHESTNGLHYESEAQKRLSILLNPAKQKPPRNGTENRIDSPENLALLPWKMEFQSESSNDSTQLVAKHSIMHVTVSLVEDGLSAESEGNNESLSASTGRGGSSMEEHQAPEVKKSAKKKVESKEARTSADAASPSQGEKMKASSSLNEIKPKRAKLSDHAKLVLWLNKWLYISKQSPLAASFRDGTKLAKLIQALLKRPIRGIIWKPSSHNAILQNIESILKHLEMHTSLNIKDYSVHSIANGDQKIIFQLLEKIKSLNRKNDLRNTG